VSDEFARTSFSSSPSPCSSSTPIHNAARARAETRCPSSDMISDVRHRFDFAGEQGRARQDGRRRVRGMKLHRRGHGLRSRKRPLNRPALRANGTRAGRITVGPWVRRTANTHPASHHRHPRCTGGEARACLRPMMRTRAFLVMARRALSDSHVSARQMASTPRAAPGCAPSSLQSLLPFALHRSPECSVRVAAPRREVCCRYKSQQTGSWCCWCLTCEDVSRSRSAPRLSELLDSSTEAPGRSVSPDGHELRPGGLSAPACLASVPSSLEQTNSRRVLFSMDEETEKRRGRSSTLVAGTPKGRTSTKTTTFGVPTRSVETKTKTKPTLARTPHTHLTSPRAPAPQAGRRIERVSRGASSSSLDENEVGREGEGRGEEEEEEEEASQGVGGESSSEASGESLRSAGEGSSEELSVIARDEMEEDSDYDEVMSVRRSKAPPPPKVGGEGANRNTPAAAASSDNKSSNDKRTGDKHKVCGVGMLLERDGAGQLVVTKLARGGAARQHGGIVVGDLLHKVDETSVRGRSLEEVAARICGDAGTYTTLHLLRGRRRMPVAVRLRRRRLHERDGESSRAGDGAWQDARIADLVADMAEQEVSCHVGLRAQGWGGVGWWRGCVDCFG
jgi:hypothetical protein